MNLPPVEFLRSQALKRRRALSETEMPARSSQVARRFLTFLPPAFFTRSPIVALYRAMPGELRAEHLESPLRALGARICFPRIVAAGSARHAHEDRVAKTLEFALVPAGHDQTMHWDEGPYGLREPQGSLTPLDPRAIDLMVVPGAAFGRGGERIGLGGGYYDRFLMSCPRAFRVGLGFDFQIFPALPQEPWDERMHFVGDENSGHWVTGEAEGLAALRAGAEVRFG